MSVEVEETGKVYVKLKSYPTKSDSDGDGLLDGRRIETNGKIIAPQDEHPLLYDGPKGMWTNHIATASQGGIPTGLDGWYGFTQPAEYLENTGTEGFRTSYEEMQYLLDEEIVIVTDDELPYIKNFYSILLALDSGISLEKIVLDLLKEAMDGGLTERIERLQRLLDSIQSGNFENASSVQEVLDFLRGHVTAGQDANQVLASLGSRLLNFKADSQGVVHSQYNTWQSIGGYNNAYDAIFSYGTNGNMDPVKFWFELGSKEYILWAWHGDYLTIGAGCELGFYSRDESDQSFEPLDHYRVDQNLAVPMQLYLYNYYSSSNIENILSYQPTEAQWWITGFNPEHAGLANVSKEVMVACVDFSKFTFEYRNDMYDKFKEQISTKPWLTDFVLYDDDKQTIWILMYKGSLI